MIEGSNAMSRRLGKIRLNTVINVAILVAAVIVLFRPSGPGTAGIREWYADWRTSRLIKSEWEALAGVTSHLGNGETVAVVMFTDYQCPFCAEAELAIAEFLESNPTHRVAVRHLPLPMHENATDAARLAVCAEIIGRFPSAHTYLFSAADWDEGIEDVASAFLESSSNVTMELIDCMHSDLPLMRLRQDSLWVARLGLRGTPSFVSRSGRVHVGVPSTQDLTDLATR